MEVSADTGTSWSDIAAWYDQLLRDGSGPRDTGVACLLGLIPDLTGTTVLDVACGQGLATRAVAEAGAARVVGTDASDAMTTLARRHPNLPRSDISYIVDDAQRLDAFPDGTFDGVTCQLGLMDIPDLHATLAAIHRVLRPGGWFVFVIGHPLCPRARRPAVAPARRASGGEHHRLLRREVLADVEPERCPLSALIESRAFCSSKVAFEGVLRG